MDTDATVLSDISAFVGNVGFPIAITAYFAWLNKTYMDKIHEQCDSLLEHLMRKSGQ